VKETFDYAAGHARWKSLDDAGDADARAPLYNPNNSSRGTVRNIISPLREMLHHAVDTGILTANPANRCGRYMKANQAAKANR